MRGTVYLWTLIRDLFPLIPELDEGMIGMRVGGERLITIPESAVIVHDWARQVIPQGATIHICN